jgi:hypothetical protein
LGKNEPNKNAERSVKIKEHSPKKSTIIFTKKNYGKTVAAQHVTCNLDSWKLFNILQNKNNFKFRQL